MVLHFKLITYRDVILADAYVQEQQWNTRKYSALLSDSREWIGGKGLLLVEQSFLQVVRISCFSVNYEIEATESSFYFFFKFYNRAIRTQSHINLNARVMQKTWK